MGTGPGNDLAWAPVPEMDEDKFPPTGHVKLSPMKVDLLSTGFNESKTLTWLVSRRADTAVCPFALLDACVAIMRHFLVLKNMSEGHALFAEEAVELESLWLE